MTNALRHSNFRIYWIGALISFIGTWLQGTALSWLVRSLTEKPIYLGMVAFFGSAPFALSLFGGVLADRMDKKIAIAYTQAFLGLFAGILAYLTINRIVQLPYIMLIAFGSGTAAAFDSPLRQSFVYHLVDKDDLHNAIALNSVGFNIARIIGPACAGIVIAQWGLGSCFVLNALSFGAVLIALLFVKVDTRPSLESQSSIWSDLAESLHYINKNPQIRGLILMVAIPALLTFPYNSLLPIFARDILHRSAQGFGLMLSAIGAGALAGALVLSQVSAIIGKGRMMLLAVAFAGVSLVGLSLSRDFTLSLACLACIGFGVVIYLASTNTLLQILSSDEMRGRVMGAYVFMFLGMGPLGSLIMGTTAQLLGPPTAVAIGGATALALGLFVWVRRPDIRTL